MTIAEILSPVIELPFGGRRWRILFTHELLLKLESSTGLDVLAGNLNLVRPAAKTLRSVLFEILTHVGADCSIRAAGEILHLGNVMNVRNILFRAWQASMPERNEEEDSENADEGESAKQAKSLSWPEAWAMAHENLRLTDREWLDLTPKLLQALLRRHIENLRQWELMFGMVIANNANYSQLAPKEPLRADAFMLHPWAKQREQPITGEYLMRHFAQFRKQG